MQERMIDQARTDLQILGATAVSANLVDITIKNTGTTKLADFERWDVIIDYTSSALGDLVTWYPYGDWTRQIYISAATSTYEELEPNILNPGEEMIINVSISIPINPGSSNVAIISTPNGIAVSAPFAGP